MNEHSEQEKKLLLKLARDAIAYGLKNHKIMPIDINQYPENLQKQGATFVTLQINKQLRGCIGSLQAYQPLVKDLAHNAYAAAFSDPRFTPLTEDEFPKLDIHISILNKPEPMQFTSEQDLIRQLQPGIDGLILSDNGHRGTFLPSVWESLPEPALFFAHLKLKAGLPHDYWSDTLTVHRYTVESIH
jgi:AmmeMemoRadiSam system protein A